MILSHIDEIFKRAFYTTTKLQTIPIYFYKKVIAIVIKIDINRINYKQKYKLEYFKLYCIENQR